MLRPRLWLIDQADFGKVSKPEWIDPESEQGRLLGTAVDQVAARIQHDFMFRVLRRRNDEGIRSWESLAKAIPDFPVKPRQLDAVARGDQRLQLTHIAALERHFGGTLLVGLAAEAALRDAKQWREQVEARAKRNRRR